MDKCLRDFAREEICAPQRQFPVRSLRMLIAMIPHFILRHIMRAANGRFLGMTTAGWRPKVLPLHQLTMPDSFSVEQKSRNPVRFPD
jgi:hypothetical protein